jgi:hypothetical protein
MRNLESLLVGPLGAKLLQLKSLSKTRELLDIYLNACRVLLPEQVVCIELLTSPLSEGYQSAIGKAA